ncbi:MAG: hypothetical protein JO249_20030 [Acidobacteria bacterium]|nr:hypothetical protein [Acidobacteriota bacterium]
MTRTRIITYNAIANVTAWCSCLFLGHTAFESDIFGLLFAAPQLFLNSSMAVTKLLESVLASDIRKRPQARYTAITFAYSSAVVLAVTAFDFLILTTLAIRVFRHPVGGIMLPPAA